MIRVDFPKQNEKVQSSDYTFRISTQGFGPVEVSLNDGPWQVCRPSLGFWWFDWRAGDPGRHKLVARCQNGNHESAISTKPRYFHVVRNGDTCR